jgi:hypothetical protein
MRVGNLQDLSVDDTVVVGNHNRVIGNHNTITGNHNRVTGSSNTLTGNHNTVNGPHNRCTGNHNSMVGDDNKATGSYNRINAVEQKGGGTGMIVRSGGGVTAFASGGMIVNAGSVRSYGQRIVMDADGITVDRVRVEPTVINNFNGSTEPAIKKARPKETRFVQCPTETEAKEHDKESTDDAAAACSICMSNQLTCIVTPCMHRCLCCACARTLSAEGTKERGSVKCPICQAEVKKMKVVY